MRILLACQQGPPHYPVPAYGFWRAHFAEGLREAGHEVIEVPEADWARGLTWLSRESRTSWRDEVWSRTLATARGTPGLDLFLSYLFPAQIDPSAVRALRDRGLPTVNFFCDNLRDYQRLPSEFGAFDAHWVPELEALPLYASRGWRAIFAPMPCWVPPGRRAPVEQEVGGICFVGRADRLRRELLRPVAESGLPLRIAGAGWEPQAQGPAAPRPWQERIETLTDFLRRQGLPRTWRRLTGSRAPAAPDFDFTPWLHKAPDDAGYADLLRTSAVALGINRFEVVSGEPRRTYSRLRDIEAPMLGACYLTEWTPELPQLYELGREIVTYRSTDELIFESRRLLQEPRRREALRAAGARRALADHTVGRSVARIAREIGLANSS